MADIKVKEQQLRTRGKQAKKEWKQAGEHTYDILFESPVVD